MMPEKSRSPDTREARGPGSRLPPGREPRDAAGRKNLPRSLSPPLPHRLPGLIWRMTAHHFSARRGPNRPRTTSLLLMGILLSGWLHAAPTLPAPALPLPGEVGESWSRQSERGVAEVSYVDPTTGMPGVGTVLRAFDKPAQNWLPGHRGVDLALAVGAPVLAAGAGVVVFSGQVAGTPTLSIDHLDGIRTTYQPVFSLVTQGEEVLAGQEVGRLANPTDHWPGLQWGARRGGEYLNPLSLLEQVVIRLKPVDVPVSRRP